MAQDPMEKKFNVRVERIREGQVLVEAHEQKIVLSTQGTDPSLGITAPETVLAAFGACVVSNINKITAETGLKIEGVTVEFEAKKRLAPLGFDDLRYTVAIKSSESVGKLQALYERATTNGTATNVLLEGLKPTGRLAINK